MSTHTRGCKTAIVLLGLALAVTAPVSSMGAELKVGFVNFRKAIDQSPQMEDARKRMEREFEARDRELLAQQKQVRSLEDKLVKNAAVMSASERQRQDQEVRKLKRELRRSLDEFREDRNLRVNQELSKLQRKVVEIIQSMAKTQKYDLIVTDGVIYASPKVDITQRVIEQLESEFKRSGGS